MDTTVIGIDFSTDPRKTGLAVATVSTDRGRPTAILREACTASATQRPRLRIVSEWIRASSDTPVLIAIDAPLGWPGAMRNQAFSSHVAGDPIDVCASYLFSRETDRRIKARTSKNPFEVGANLIARTAHGALKFLHDLSTELNGPDAKSLPLTWSSADIHRPSVIEVYPAATLEAHGISPGSYKKSGMEGRSYREEIVRALHSHGVEGEVEVLARNDHLVDAAVCVLAGQDFLTNRAVGPEPGKTMAQAQREGWIWAASFTVTECDSDSAHLEGRQLKFTLVE